MTDPNEPLPTAGRAILLYVLAGVVLLVILAVVAEAWSGGRQEDQLDRDVDAIICEAEGWDDC